MARSGWEENRGRAARPAAPLTQVETRALCKVFPYSL